MPAKTPPPLMQIKHEKIKEYAESAMNELLGWYGYCNNNEHSSNQINLMTNKLLSKHTKKMSKHTNSQASMLTATTSTDNGHTSHATNSTFDDFDPNIDSRSSTDDSMKMSPNFLSAKRTIHSISTQEKSETDDCGWCKRLIPFGAPEFLTTPEGLKYCTESCFTQSRRASYKRAKTCEWCKHIRHAVSYVNFQDGATQLQFCSEKCLNQYKMQVFCKEIQAQLDLNPDLRGKGRSTEDELITPEMWMKNCRSRSMSPDDRSTESDTTSHTSDQRKTSIKRRLSSIKDASPLDLIVGGLSTAVDSKRSQQTISNENETIGNLSSFHHRLSRKRRLQRTSTHSTICDMTSKDENEN